MFFEDKHQIGIFVLANIAAICASGQNYADRSNLPTGIAAEDDKDDDLLLHTNHYDWSKEQISSNIWPWHVKGYPHPQLNPRFCHRMTVSNVCNPDDVIIPDEANRLDATIRKIFNNTQCICDKCGPNDGGTQVGIALLKYTFKPYLIPPYTIIRSFTQNLRSKWHLSDCENDILIVLASEDRVIYTDVGRAVSKFISKADAHEIFKKNKAYFSKEMYYEGLQAMLIDIQNATKALGKHTEDSEMGIALVSGIVVIIVIVVGVLVIIAVIIYKRRTDKKVSRCQSDGTKTSSWRPKNIKLLLSSFVSSSDAYQPCKTQEGKEGTADNQKAANGHSQNDDEEILNLELAEPEPKIVDADVETAEANHQDIDALLHNEAHDEVDGENPDPQITEENLINSASDNQQDAADEVQLPEENNGSIFQLCTPKLYQDDVVDEEQLPMEDNGSTLQTLTPELQQDDVVAEVQLPTEDNPLRFQTFAFLKSPQKDVKAEVQLPTENKAPTFQTFTPKSRDLYQTDL